MGRVEQFAAGEDADGADWKLDLEQLPEDQWDGGEARVCLYGVQPLYFDRSTGLEFVDELLNALAQLVGPARWMHHRPAQPRIVVVEAMDDSEETAKTVEHVKREINKGGTPARAVAGVLGRSLLAAFAPRSPWARKLARWQKMGAESKRSMEIGMASMSTPRPEAFSPRELVELAEHLEKNQSPYAVGRLLYAVLDVVATIEGDKPA